MPRRAPTRPELSACKPENASLIGSAVAIDPLGRGTWVVDQERDELALISPLGPARTFRVGAWPEQVVVEPSGRVYVSCRQAGRVEVIDRDFTRHSVELPGEPRALALDATLGRLYVGLVTARALVEIDAGSLRELARRSLEAAPYAVARFGASVVSLPRLGGSLALVRCDDLSDLRRVDLPSASPDRRSWHGQALVRDGADLFVAYASVDTGLDRPPLAGGYGGRPDSPVLHNVALLRDTPLSRTPAIHRGLAVLPAGDITGGVVRGNTLVLASRAAGTLILVPLARERDGSHRLLGPESQCRGAGPG